MNRPAPQVLFETAEGLDQPLAESAALDAYLAAQGLESDERARIWRGALELLRHGPLLSPSAKSTVLALGRIQSGKTTAISATTALGRDLGYRLIVAVLGSTKLLVDQNTRRLLAALGIGTGLRSTYGWMHIDSRHLSDSASRRFSDAVTSERTILITTLKHPRHLEKLSDLVERGKFIDLPTLIIDDEADQASLNTEILEGGDSPTHRSLGNLYATLEQVLYAQFTATPYAPLLIEPSDVLSPRSIVILEQGKGYTGAKEFFIDNAATIVRKVSDKESSAETPALMPDGLREALANFLIGAAWLLAMNAENAPVSMLAHSSHKTDTHKQLDTLIRRELDLWDKAVRHTTDINLLPAALTSQIKDLIRTTGREPPAGLLDSIKRVQLLKHVWIVNSKADEDRVDWSVSPAHVLIGGNKLDRGFTVEGLTVTYLSRPRSAQLDTLYQRARAFGYRAEYLPYCRFYANRKTINSFRLGIETDLAMRRSLASWAAAGKDVRQWSDNEPLLLERGIRPTRPEVLPAMDVRDMAGWHFASRPSLRITDIEANRMLVENVGLISAPRREFGALAHRFLEVPIDAAGGLIREWKCDGGCGFDQRAVSEFLLKVAEGAALHTIPVLLLEAPEGRPRERSWSSALGVTALLQGRYKDYTRDLNNSYAGDRYIMDGRSHVQIHRLHLRNSGVDELFTIAVNIGNESSLTTQLRRANP